ncbi:unnamed protein product [Rhizoctonia solani]|uniref:Uncharacterized protein n=1 Tax=Rhizoctonia solani TaxID=456999 RepID=A0A8H3E403_9AGAM|nr:unnamed protein product [Rhizoctonia solani]
MPRRLVCLFGSEFYHDHARLLQAEYMVRDKTKQLVTLVRAEVPLSVETKPAKPTGIKGMLQRKSTIAQKEPPPPPYTKAVSDAYGFINEHYQPGDEIILFAVTGTQYDWPVLRAAVQVLAEHLGAGTEPTRVAPDLDPKQVTDEERDVFDDRPPKEVPKNILAKKIESSVAILYSSPSSLTEINNALLEEFPLSAKHIFSFNWAAGRENYCNSFRDDTGMLTSREVGYFKNIQWHIPVVVVSP